MAQVGVHCYGGCGATTQVDPETLRTDLAHAGWANSAGKTYCPRCAPEHGLRPAPALTRAEPGSTQQPEPSRSTGRGCLVDIAIAFGLLLVVGLLGGAFQHVNNGAGDSYSINLTTVPTIVWLALLAAYWFGYRRPRRARRAD